MPDIPDRADLLNRDLPDLLDQVAGAPAEMTPDATAYLLREAAQMIRDLRILVGIREEIELEDMEPKGRA